MRDRHVAYFDVTAELLLTLLKARSDIPETAVPIRVEANPQWDARMFGETNIIRFYIESPDLQVVKEGEMCREILPTYRGPR